MRHQARVQPSAELQLLLGGARRGGARGELNLQRGNWVLSRYHVITLQYSTTAGLAAISPVDILHVHKYLVTCSKPLKIWHIPRFCWRPKPSQFYLLDVLIGSMVCILSHGVDSLHCNYPVSASLRQRCDQWQCDKVAARHYPTTGDIAAWDRTLATLRITSKWRCIDMCIAKWEQTLALASLHIKTKWRCDNMRSQEILRPNTAVHWRPCTLQQSGGATLCDHRRYFSLRAAEKQIVS